MPPFRHAARLLSGVALVASALVASALVAVVPATAHAAATSDSLLKGQRLGSGATLVSADGRTRLVMQGDGNLVLYSPSKALWSSRTSGRPGATFVVQPDGNMVVYDTTGAPRWWSSTHDVASLKVQSDGNLVARTATGVARWATGTVYPPPSSGPWRSADGRFYAGMQGDGNFVLRFAGSASPDALWAAGTGGHPQAWLAAQSDGNLVIRENGKVLWASGSSGHPGAAPKITNDGDLTVASSSAGVVWHSNTAKATAGVDGGSADPRFTKVWSHVLGGPGSVVGLGSVGVGTLDGSGTSVLFGTRSGQIHAFHTSDGGSVAGWPVNTGGIGVDSTPAVAGSGASARVYVGVGTSSRPAAGGLYAWNAGGHALWTVRPDALYGGGGTVGVMSSPAVGNLQTGSDVVSGAMGLMGYAVSSSGSVLPGFPWYQGDTNFSTPALADLDGDGRDEAVFGGDSSAGPAFGRTWTNGGHIRIVENTGRAGKATAADATTCDYVSDQVIQSSPAIGRIYGGGKVGIVVGTGTWFQGARDTNTLFALNTACHVIWRATLDGPAVGSPSLIDVDGNGSLEVVTTSNTGTVYVINGSTGRIQSATNVGGRIFGGVASVDIAGRRSLLVGSTAGVAVIDGPTGRITGQLAPQVAVQGTPAVTLDPGGAIGVTVAGLNYQQRGVAMHFRLNGATATTVTGPGQWPMFHRDGQLRGSTL